MKQLVSVVIFIISALYTRAQTREPYSEDVRNALINGAKAKVTIKVVDEEGKPVTNAVAGAFFRMTYGENPGDTIEGVTDNNGLFTAEGKTTDIVFISAKKDGYYLGRNKFHASKEKKLDGDKWLPWDVTSTVVLRKIKNQVPMCRRQVMSSIPADAKSGELFFDLMIGDWVKPYGNGEIADLTAVFEYSENFSERFKCYETENFRFVFNGDKNGCYINEKIPNSEFETEYSASLDNIYTNKLEAHSKIYVITDKQYLVFRIRSKIDKDGNVISAYYGVCKENFQLPLGFWDFRTKYFININENERSLEFDGDYSHSKRKRRR